MDDARKVKIKELFEKSYPVVISLIDTIGCWWILLVYLVECIVRSGGHFLPLTSHRSCDFKLYNLMDHFTVVFLVAWPLNEREAGVDLQPLTKPGWDS